MIYFIQDIQNRAIKIGFTESDPKKRLQSLQTGSSSNLRILGCIPGDRLTETFYHNHLSEYHIRGEWYRSNFKLAVMLFARQMLPECHCLYGEFDMPEFVTLSHVAKYLKLDAIMDDLERLDFYL